VSNNHHEGHEDNEVKILQALHVLHGKNYNALKKSYPASFLIPVIPAIIKI